MSSLPTYEALQARYAQHEAAAFSRAADEGEAALAAALEAIGWRAAGEDAVEEVAAQALLIVGACVNGHRDPRVAARDLADLMRHYAPRHSDFLAPAAEFLPAAEEVLRRYAAGAPRARERLDLE